MRRLSGGFNVARIFRRLFGMMAFPVWHATILQKDGVTEKTVSKPRGMEFLLACGDRRRRYP